MLVDLRPGQPVRFGKNLNKGLRLKGLELEAFEVTPENEGTAIKWDPANPNPAIAFMMAQLEEGVMPTPIGVFRNVEASVFERGAHDQIEKARAKHGPGDLQKLLYSGDLWDVS